MSCAVTESIAIFGGTFDPIHLGHINAVTLLSERFSFDRIHWVLSARPPHKNQTSASIEHRFELIKLALAGMPNHVADDTEIRRNAKSYTIDTVEAFQQRYPNAQLTVIIGGDSVLSLPSWYRYNELIDKVNWLVMSRPGYELNLSDELQGRVVSKVDDLLKTRGGSIYLFDESDFNVSSTQLRAELGAFAEESAISLKLSKEFLPNDVFSYIQQQQLYRIAPTKSG